MKLHHTTNHASTTTPHRVSMPTALLFWRRVDFMPDVLLSPRIPGHFKVTRGALQCDQHALAQALSWHRSCSPSSGNAPCMRLPFRGSVPTTHPPSSGGMFGLSIHLPPWGGASALLMRLPPGDGASALLMRLPPGDGASALLMRLPPGDGTSGLPMRPPPGDGASCMCPVTVGSNASSFVAAAFLALPAGSMLEVPLARAGAVPTAGTLRLYACGSAAPRSSMSTPGGRLSSHLHPRSQPMPPLVCVCQRSRGRLPLRPCPHWQRGGSISRASDF